MQSAIKPPSRKQLLILRLMILIGLVCMGFLLYSLLKKNVVGYKPLYWLLMSTFIYTFFKVMYEWYHYWAISVPETPLVTRPYTVDMFTTFCAGEPYEMIVETLTALKAVTYPHETYLCDEADDAFLKKFCEEIGVHHITRTKKINAKAGNINNALQQSTGELCVVLDPDHIPAPEFLDDLVSHFDNPEIGYVQIVQAYYNQDTGWIAKGAAQQTYQFYGPMMMCMNTYGTVQAIGANCTFRRTALESIGGHAAGLAEDMHTAMQLHAKKWKSVYVPKVLSKGLVPTTLSAYYKQQLKWSRGVFELLVTSYVKLFKQFNWRQKLHYGLLPLFYLSGFVFLINFLIPVISLFADVFPLKMDFSAFLVISIPFITSVILIRHYVQQWVMEDNERGFHIVGGLLLIGSWWVFILGFVYTIIRKNVPYIPTPKDIRDEKNLKINLPNITVFAVSIIAIIYGLYNDWNPFTFFMSGIVGLNCLFMIFMFVASSELKFQKYLTHHARLATLVYHIRLFKKKFWLFRRRVYSGARTVSLMTTVFIICVCLYVSTNSGNTNIVPSVNITAGGLMTGKAQYGGGQSLINSAPFDTTVALGLSKQQPSTLGGPVIKVTDTALLTLPTPNYMPATRGVIYSKANYWYKNVYALNKRTISNDFAEMKNAGINTVKIYGPNIYDRITFDIAGQQNMDVNYSFWIPAPSGFINYASNLQSLQENIIETINKNKANPNIKAWNLGNSTFQQLALYYHKPQLFYAEYNYLVWLKGLIRQMKQADGQRPVTIDVAASATLNETIKLLHRHIPEIDAFGLIITDKASLNYVTDTLGAPYFFSNVNPKALYNSVLPSKGIFYANWQDQETGSVVTFDGLKDLQGRNKPYLSKISSAWHGKIPTNNLPDVKILRPALTTLYGSILPYQAMVYLYDKWNLAAYLKTGLNFEWYLIKTDEYGNEISITPVGTGPTLNLTMPDNMKLYRLYLVAGRGNNVTDATSILNIPLKN